MGRKKKYLTEEEKKQAHIEAVKKYREKHHRKVLTEEQKEKKRIRDRKYREDNRDKLKEYYKKYREENIEKVRKSHLKSYHKHKEEHKTEKNEKQREKYKNNLEYYKTFTENWRKENPIAYRASYLRSSYNASDIKYGRGKGDLTTQWIIENILLKPCAHCGIEGWEAIGCNRLDNSKPHTMDNVEPCCLKCNVKLPRLVAKSCLK